MPRRVHQIENVILAVQSPIFQSHRLGFDGDAAFALDVHGIEHLILHFAGAQSATKLNEAVGKRGLPMIDMRDDGKIPDMCEVGHGTLTDRERQPAGPVRARRRLRSPGA